MVVLALLSDETLETREAWYGTSAVTSDAVGADAAALIAARGRLRDASGWASVEGVEALLVGTATRTCCAHEIAAAAAVPAAACRSDAKGSLRFASVAERFLSGDGAA